MDSMEKGEQQELVKHRTMVCLLSWSSFEWVLKGEVIGDINWHKFYASEDVCHEGPHLCHCSIFYKPISYCYLSHHLVSKGCPGKKVNK